MRRVAEGVREDAEGVGVAGRQEGGGDNVLHLFEAMHDLKVSWQDSSSCTFAQGST